MEKYETFSTTADVGIRIRGNGYGEFFQSAVKGLNLLYFDEAGVTVDGVTEPYPFEFHGDSLENVLVNLLAEIVYLLQNHDKITAGIDIEKVNETYLKADLLTEPCREEPGMEIKSVTYHNLRIKKENGVLSAEVVFDV